MKRREFIGLIGGAAASWSLAVRAQQPAKIAQIGWMSRGNASGTDTTMNAFRQGLRELGYAEGQTFVIEPRHADGSAELMAAQAADLERLGVDVIIAGPFEALQAAKQSTSRVPIIMTPSVDPVAAGIVANLDHPEGNITGITEMMPELTPQRLEILEQIVPNLRRVAILLRPGALREATIEKILKDTQASAQGAGIRVQIVATAGVEDFDAAFSAMAKEGVDSLIVLVNPMFFLQRKHIIERAENYRLPAIYECKSFAQSGGLISYGADVLDVYRRAAGYVDKILKGAKPADLPIQQPTKFELVVNLKTAKALGLTVPQSILARADEVIE